MNSVEILLLQLTGHFTFSACKTHLLTQMQILNVFQWHRKLFMIFFHGLKSGQCF